MIHPDDPHHFYDYRALYRAQMDDPRSESGHYPSEFKTEGHPRAYLPDEQNRLFDTRTSKYLNGDPVSPDALQASENAPDTGWKDEDIQALQALGQALKARKGKQ